MKKLLLTVALISMFVFAFVLVASAETPDQYIEFGARFPGSDEYITVYTQNAESTGNPQINFTSYKFYSDVEFTQEVDMSTVTGIDFSVAKTHGCNGNAPTRMKKPSSPFVNCVEVKWFLAGMPTVSYEGAFFKGWTGLKSFDFGNATAINDNTFEGAGFETITIPATITSIGGSAFKNCSNLKSVKFEGDIKKFNNGATFYGCKALTSVEMENLTSIGTSMFESCTSLESITIPNGVTSIGNNAFYGCSALASISIPNNVTSIGSSALRSTALVSVTIPSSVASVGNEAFRQSGSLTTVVFEGADTTLGTSMFMGCGKLENVTLPKNLSKIPSSSFWGCGKVQFVNLSEMTSLTTIGSSAFQDTETLVFTLPDTVTTIESQAFRSAFKKSGSFTVNPTSQLQIIGNDAFNDCRALQSIYIPSTVTSIGSGAFLQTYALKELENFENCQITEIAEKTFQSATKLTSIKIPQTVTTIAANAFYGNEKLALVYIPRTVTSIGDTFTGSQSANVVYIYTGNDASVLSACTRIAGANVIPSSEYDPSATYTGINLVVGYSHCIAYNNGVHSEPVTDLVFKSYLESITIACNCSECGIGEDVGEIPALFTCYGFSAPENGDGGIIIGFASNNEAIEEYKKLSGKEISFGVFVVSERKLGENDIFGKDGSPADGVVSLDMTNRSFAMFDLKITGFTTEQKDMKLAVGAYVAVTDNTTDATEYSYMQAGTPNEGEKYSFASFNDVIATLN